jgi:hypothetical protein
VLIYNSSEAYLPRCTVGSRQAKHRPRRVDGREDDMVKSMAIALYRDETIRREGLQARGAYKEVLSLAFGWALATPKSS